jgi:hypothetical protein
VLSGSLDDGVSGLRDQGRGRDRRGPGPQRAFTPSSSLWPWPTCRPRGASRCHRPIACTTFPTTWESHAYVDTQPPTRSASRPPSEMPGWPTPLTSGRWVIWRRPTAR